MPDRLCRWLRAASAWLSPLRFEPTILLPRFRFFLHMPDNCSLYPFPKDSDDGPGKWHHMPPIVKSVFSGCPEKQTAALNEENEAAPPDRTRCHH